MRKLVVLVILLVIFGCPKNISQPQKSSQDEIENYYPLKMGYSWSYMLTQGDSNQIIKTEVVQINGNEIKINTNNNIFYYIRTEEGIMKKLANYYILRKPIQKGISWEFKSSGFSGKVLIVDILSECKVRDSTYKNCLMTEETLQGQNILLKTYYAEGVGPVLIEEYTITTGRPQLTTRAELLGYSFAQIEQN